MAVKSLTAVYFFCVFVWTLSIVKGTSYCNNDGTASAECCGYVSRGSYICQSVPNNRVYWEATTLPRGGGQENRVTKIRTSDQKRPRMDHESLALTLRLACEMNRRLYCSTAALSLWGSSGVARRIKNSNHRRHLHMELIDDNDGTSNPSSTTGPQVPSSVVNVHPSQPWHQPVQRRRPLTSDAHDQLTIFHESHPRTVPPHTTRTDTRRVLGTGVHRWGPDLTLYLKNLSAALLWNDSSNSRGGDESIFLALTLLYLDRACSIETRRYNKDSSSLPCPYVSPRTVHRLLLTAMVLSHRVLYQNLDLDPLDTGCFTPESTRLYAHKLSSFGTTVDQLRDMERWMVGALGEDGLNVQVERVERLLRNWSNVFFFSDYKSNDHFSNDNDDDTATGDEDTIVGNEMPREDEYKREGRIEVPPLRAPFQQQNNHHSSPIQKDQEFPFHLHQKNENTLSPTRFHDVQQQQQQQKQWSNKEESEKRMESHHDNQGNYYQNPRPGYV